MQVFVSHSHLDFARAHSVAEALEHHGHSVFIDTEMGSGVIFRRRLEREVERADAVLVIWTKTSVSSQWVQAEARAAMGKLRPVRVRVMPPAEFGELHTPDVSLHASGEDIVRAVGLATQRPPPPPAATDCDRVSPDDWDVGLGSKFLNWITKPR